jgi:hypothetical protein
MHVCAYAQPYCYGTKGTGARAYISLRVLAIVPSHLTPLVHSNTIIEKNIAHNIQVTMKHGLSERGVRDVSAM